MGPTLSSFCLHPVPAMLQSFLTHDYQRITFFRPLSVPHQYVPYHYLLFVPSLSHPCSSPAPTLSQSCPVRSGGIWTIPYCTIPNCQVRRNVGHTILYHTKLSGQEECGPYLGMRTVLKYQVRQGSGKRCWDGEVHYGSPKSNLHKNFLLLSMVNIG